MNPALDTDSMDAQREAAEQDRLNAERTFAGDVAWLMSSPRGRRLAGWVLNTAGVSRPSFNNSGSITAFNEGMRAIGIVFQDALVKHAAGNYLVMLEEGITEKAKTK